MRRSPPVIIYRLGSMGDTIVTLPCFHAIRRAFPDRELLCLTNKPVSGKAAPVESILGPGGLIDGAIAYPVGTRSPRALWRVLRALRATGADTLVYLTEPRGPASVRRDLLFFRLAGLRNVLGAPLTPDLHHNRVDPATGEEEPEAERLARTLAAVERIDLSLPANWDLRLTAEERGAAMAALAPLDGGAFLAINMGGKDAFKQWGDDRWRALLTRLAPDWGELALVAVGAREDRETSARAIAVWPGATLNLCGDLAPRASAAALGEARLLVGHDSGPLHLAAAMGTPTVGIFGNWNRPRRWFPYGARSVVIHEPDGLEALGVERVFAAVDDALRNASR